MDRFDLENKIMNASLICNDLETLAEEMDEDENVPAPTADKYSLALLGLAKLCEARFNAIDRVYDSLIPLLDADEKRVRQVREAFESMDTLDEKLAKHNVFNNRWKENIE